MGIRHSPTPKLSIQAHHHSPEDCQPRSSEALPQNPCAWRSKPVFQTPIAPLQADVKALFGSYPQACTAADLMLISLGQPALLADR